MGKLFVTLFAFNTAYNTAFNTLINPDMRICTLIKSCIVTAFWLRDIPIAIGM
jgi:hypothetical protein